MQTEIKDRTLWKIKFKIGYLRKKFGQTLWGRLSITYCVLTPHELVLIRACSRHRPFKAQYLFFGGVCGGGHCQQFLIELGFTGRFFFKKTKLNEDKKYKNIDKNWGKIEFRFGIVYAEK